MPPKNSIEYVNYSYLIIATVLLFICYYYLQNTKTALHAKKLERDDRQRKTVTVKTKKGDVKMDPNIFELHIKRMKDNILELNKNFSGKDCGSIKKQLERTKMTMEKYIKMNTNEISSDFIRMGSKIQLVDDHILQESEMVKKKLANITESDSDSDILSDEIKYSILEILIDIDIILFLIKSSLCNKGILDLSTIDNLIIKLYRNNCLDPEHTNLNQQLNNLDDAEFASYRDKFASYRDGFPSYRDGFTRDRDGFTSGRTANMLSSCNKIIGDGRVANMLSGSQVMKDGPAVFYENRLLTQHNKLPRRRQKIEINNNFISHERQHDFIDNIGKNGAKFNASSHKLNNGPNIQAALSYNPHIDRNSRTSLG
jgi:hypothetical protein